MRTFITRLRSHSLHAAGFSLIEILVVLAIFSILTVVVLAQYGSFNSTTLLNSLAYDVALSIREAQVLGISVRGDSGTFSSAYGMHFTDGTEYTLFIDENDNDRYDDGEAVSTYAIGQDNAITDLCANTTCGLATLDVLFRRPEPDAIVYASPAVSGISSARVFVSAPDGADRSVCVWSTGQIAVECGEITEPEAPPPAGPPTLQNTVNYTAGSGMYVVPGGIVEITVTVIGGGGGGGSSGNGGGGGGGGAAVRTYTTSGGSSFVYSVGAAGSGGSPGTGGAGGTGGSTVFGGLSASGGTGAAGTNGGAAGTGGSGSGGDSNYTGGSGGIGCYASGGGGGGGAAAGPSGSGANGSNSPCAGFVNGAGSGGGGAGVSPGGSGGAGAGYLNGAGNPGGSYGGGGGGSSNPGTQTGANGAGGLIRIQEYGS